MASPLAQLAAKVALIWLEKRPFSDEARARRKAKRKARRKARKGEPLTTEEEGLMAQEIVKVILANGETIERVEPTIKARTSTKVAGVIGTGFVATLVTMVPFYEQVNGVLLQACQSEQGPTVFLAGFAAAGIIAWVTARFTKSPAVPGKL